MARKFLTGIDLNGNLLLNAALGTNSAGTATGALAYSGGRIVLGTGSATVTLALTTDAVTIGSTSIALGATSTTLAGLSSVTSTSFVGALTGNASTATTLQTARTINGTSFDGSANITITAANPNALTIGTGLSGTSYTGASAVTIAIDSTVATLTGTQTLTNKTLTTPTINGATMTGTITVPDPTNDTDAANKRYVDSLSGGVDWKASVKYATTANFGVTDGTNYNLNSPITPTVIYSNGTSGVGATITVSAQGGNWSTATIDGQTLVVGDRILIKDTLTPTGITNSGAANGIYTVTQVGATTNSTSFIFTRATDADTTSKFTAGMATFIETGAKNADTGYVNTTDGAVTIGTTGITFTQFTGLGQVIVNSPLSKSGNTISLGTVGVGNGGTGATTLTTNGVVYGNGTSAVGVTSAGTQYQVLQAGVSNVPTFGALNLGQAAAITGTLPVGNGGTGITSFGTGVATALGINVGSAGAFVTNGGALGTPSSATLTNATGLPVSTGISGLGTGVATALAVAVGSAGAFVTNGGALGTPASGTLTNATGLPISGLVSSTVTALGVGSIELGHASDTTISRVSAGVVAIEGVNIVTTSSTDTLTNKTLTSPTLTGTPTAPTATPGTNTTQIATTAFVTAAVGSGLKKYTATNASITPSSGTATWTVTAATHGIGAIGSIIPSLKEVASGATVEPDFVINDTTGDVTVSWNASATVTAGTYRLTLIG